MDEVADRSVDSGGCSAGAESDAAALRRHEVAEQGERINEQLLGLKNEILQNVAETVDKRFEHFDGQHINLRQHYA